jgi:hypothetical protein
VKKYEDWEYEDKELNLNEEDTERLPYLYTIGI